MPAGPPGRQLHGDPLLGQAWRARMAAAAALPSCRLLLLLAGTDTAAVPGISAAGATPASRRLTAAADAELLLLGPGQPRPHALPPLPAGVSPALIARVVVEQLGLEPLVVDLGAPVAPAVPHLRLPGTLGASPARCLSSGAALAPERVAGLLAWGQRWGQRLARAGAPVLLAECVPGGTSTAQALLQGLGVEATGLVSGSLREPAHALKAALTQRGLAAAGLLQPPDAEAAPAAALAVAAAVADPMQVLAAGLLQAAALAELPVLLAGGSQMAAVLALALALTPGPQRPRLLARAAVVTTAWVAGEPGSNLTALLQHIGQRWGGEPLAFATGLRFSGCQRPELLAYEQGYVKEGVGAGGLALLWELSGRHPADLAIACDRACSQLHQPLHHPHQA
ncbi:MAG: NaMN--DMB phosphoribosyltransferase [Vulcanococcus sp.]